MPIIKLPYAYLEKLTGMERGEIVSQLPLFGADVERIEEDHADVEFFANRPDLFSVEGVSRALRGFMGLETGLKEYSPVPSGIGFTVDPALKEIRPYLGSAVIRNVSLDDEAIECLMGLQEALHWAVGRGRAKVAIGVHDMDTVRPPFRYIASAKERRFVPLDYMREMSLDEILTEHPKGRDYTHIIDKFEKYPLIVDDDDEVLSFPPIINGVRTTVTTDTRNILLDATGTDSKAVRIAIAILCTAFAETGASIESVTIDGIETPVLEPSKRQVRADECTRLLGLEMTPADMVGYLRKMRYGAVAIDEDTVEVEVPCYRSDILHDWDIYEDVAIAFGYGRIKPELPGTFTSGKEHPVMRMAGIIREIYTGMGYMEMMPFTLTSERVLFTQMKREKSTEVQEIMHPISEEQTMVRTDILPLILEIMQLNKHRELPQRLFATGDVVKDGKTGQHAASASIHPSADFSEAYSCVDAICRELGLEYSVQPSADPAFIDGRVGDIIIDGKKAGVFGEVHPVVLNSFDLEHSIAAVELDLTDLVR